MLKIKLSKEDFEKLPDSLKGEYKEKNGTYYLDTDEASNLEAALNNEKKDHKETKTKIKELEEKLSALNDEGSRKKGDVEALEKSWADKLAKVTEDHTKESSSLKNFIIKSHKDSLSLSIATEISNSPKLMQKLLNDRIAIEFSGDEPTVRILSTDGKPSALTADDLKKEFLANQELKPILLASRASGSSGAVKQTASPSGTDGKPLNLATLPAKDLAAQLNLKNE